VLFNFTAEIPFSFLLTYQKHRVILWHRQNALLPMVKRLTLKILYSGNKRKIFLYCGFRLWWEGDREIKGEM